MTLEEWNAVGTWFSGAATFGAVVLALFLQRIAAKRDEPKLLLEYDADHLGDNRYLGPELLQRRLGSQPKTAFREELWIRVKVKNVGQAQARDVEIRPLRLTTPTVGSDRYFSSWWLKVSGLGILSCNITPGFSQYYDLAFIRNHSDRDCDPTTFLSFVQPGGRSWHEEKLAIEADDDRALRTSGLYRLTISVGGSNSRASLYEICIDVSQSKNANSVLGYVQLRKTVKISTPIRKSLHHKKNDLHPV